MGGPMAAVTALLSLLLAASGGPRPATAEAADTSWYGATRHGPECVNVRDAGARGDGASGPPPPPRRRIG